MGRGNMIVEFFSAEIEFNVWKIDTSYYCIVGNMRKLIMIMMAMMMRRRRMRRISMRLMMRISKMM